MIAKNCGSRVPKPGNFISDDSALLHQTTTLLPKLRLLMDKQAFNDALGAIWAVIRAANSYVDAQAPEGTRAAFVY